MPTGRSDTTDSTPNPDERTETDGIGPNKTAGAVSAAGTAEKALHVDSAASELPDVVDSDGNGPGRAHSTGIDGEGPLGTIGAVSAVGTAGNILHDDSEPSVLPDVVDSDGKGSGGALFEVGDGKGVEGMGEGAGMTARHEMHPFDLENSFIPSPSPTTPLGRPNTPRNMQNPVVRTGNDYSISIKLKESVSTTRTGRTAPRNTPEYSPAIDDKGGDDDSRIPQTGVEGDGTGAGNIREVSGEHCNPNIYYYQLKVQPGKELPPPVTKTFPCTNSTTCTLELSNEMTGMEMDQGRIMLPGMSEPPLSHLQRLKSDKVYIYYPPPSPNPSRNMCTSPPPPFPFPSFEQQLAEAISHSLAPSTSLSHSAYVLDPVDFQVPLAGTSKQSFLADSNCLSPLFTPPPACIPLSDHVSTMDVTPVDSSNMIVSSYDPSGENKPLQQQGRLFPLDSTVQLDIGEEQGKVKEESQDVKDPWDLAIAACITQDCKQEEDIKQEDTKQEEVKQEPTLSSWGGPSSECTNRKDLQEEHTWDNPSSPTPWDNDPEPRPLLGWEEAMESALQYYKNSHPVMETKPATSESESEDTDSEISSLPSLESISTSSEEGEISSSEEESMIFDGREYILLRDFQEESDYSSKTPPPSPVTSSPSRLLSILETSLQWTGLLGNPHLIPSNSNFFEMATSEPDLWNYSDAGTFALRIHGHEYPSKPANLPKLPVPLGHPLWCQSNNQPILHQHHYINFTGLIDNHPLLTWDNRIIQGNCGEPEKYLDLGVPFYNATHALQIVIVIPEDWEARPETPFRKEVRDRIHKAILDRSLPVLSPPPIYQPITAHSSTPYPWNFKTSVDSPILWKHQPLGSLAHDDFFQYCYSNPYASEADAIAFNPWNPQVYELRRIRANLDEGIKGLALELMKPELRSFVDDSQTPESDTLHYFYRHCHLFRFMNKNLPFLAQGFSCECVHYDVQTTTYPFPPRKALPPRNPLLSAEEDEFLHHASIVFEDLGEFSLVNAIRSFRAVIPFMPQDMFLLENAGYLTPLAQFDMFGRKFPVVWESPPLRL